MTVSISKANAFSSSKPDYSAIRAILNNSKIQTTNNPLWQSIVNLITAGESTQSIQTSFSEAVSGTLANIQIQIDNLTIDTITLVEVDTAGGPTNIILSSVVSNFTVIKDSTGHATANPITLVGTVDGTVDPTINIDYDKIRVYSSGTTFLSW